MIADNANALRGMFGPRTFLISVLPTAGLGLMLTVLIWAGAPGPLHLNDAWRAVSALGTGEVVLLAVALIVLVIVLQPLQVPMVRLLEGYWPRWLAPLARFGLWRQDRRRKRLARAATPPQGDHPVGLQLAGQRGAALRALYPLGDTPLLPTALGNVLTAAEARAGREYGLDAVVAWPRLYPVLDVSTRSIVDDRRNTLDALVRLSVSAIAAAVVATPLLSRSGAWLLIVAGFLVLARVSYRGAVRAAVAYGESLCVAFDLNRFALARRMRLPLPGDQAAERAANEALCTMWRQAPDKNVLTYHDEPESRD